MSKGEALSFGAGAAERKRINQPRSKVPLTSKDFLRALSALIPSSVISSASPVIPNGSAGRAFSDSWVREDVSAAKKIWTPRKPDGADYLHIRDCSSCRLSSKTNGHLNFLLPQRRFTGSPRIHIAAVRPYGNLVFLRVQTLPLQTLPFS